MNTFPIDATSASSKFRYLPTEFVDRFFSDGTLLLTTYEKCRTHEDLTRRDSREGKANFFFSNGSHAIAGIQEVGKRSYLLCTSSTLTGELLARFEVNDWIEIVDPLSFAKAISNALPGFIKLQMKPCHYAGDRTIERRTECSIMPPSAQLFQAIQSNEPGAVDAAFHAMNRQLADNLDTEMGDTIFFLKEENPFSVEDEFRFVWTLDHEVGMPTVIKCMDAVKFCRPGRSDPSKIGG